MNCTTLFQLRELQPQRLASVGAPEPKLRMIRSDLWVLLRVQKQQDMTSKRLFLSTVKVGLGSLSCPKCQQTPENSCSLMRSSVLASALTPPPSSRRHTSVHLSELRLDSGVLSTSVSSSCSWKDSPLPDRRPF